MSVSCSPEVLFPCKSAPFWPFCPCVESAETASEPSVPSAWPGSLAKLAILLQSGAVGEQEIKFPKFARERRLSRILRARDDNNRSLFSICPMAELVTASDCYFYASNIRCLRNLADRKVVSSSLTGAVYFILIVSTVVVELRYQKMFLKGSTKLEDATTRTWQC